MFGPDISEKEVVSYFQRTEVEEKHLEKEVLNKLMEGQRVETISSDLGIGKAEIKKFIVKSKKALREIDKVEQKDESRLVLGKRQCEESLAQLATYVQHLIKKYDEQGDNKSTISAIRALNDTLMNYSKLSGFLKEEPEKEGKIIDVVSTKNKHLIDRMKRGVEFGRSKE